MIVGIQRFWRERRWIGESYLALGVLILLVGFVIDRVLEIPFPLFAFTAAIGILIRGYRRGTTGAVENARLHIGERQCAAAMPPALQQQELDRLKNEVIQNVSHELRTPLTIALCCAELLDHGELGTLQPDQQKVVNSIARHLSILKEMMDDFAAILDAERGELSRESVDLADLVQSLLNRLQTTAEQAGLTLTAEIEPDLPPIPGDTVQLYRVAGNLLDNAIKFTPAGGCVTVRLRRGSTGVSPNGKSGTNGASVVLEVADTGIGIPHDQLEHIFERFYQVDGSTTRRYDGVGLGLALVKEIVEAHSGRVAVRSTLDEGSAFQITLPAMASLHAANGRSRFCSEGRSE